MSFLWCFCWFLLGSNQEIKAQDDRPNIIFIMADDLGYGDLGCYGQQIIRTPHLDKMALQSTRFTRCYAGSPVCAPSRSVLMTGQHTGHTTVRGNTGKFGVQGLGGRSGRVPLKDSDTTIAEVLKSVGYVTGCVGKWGLGEPNTRGEPRQQGFDYFFGFLNQRRAHNYYPEYLWENETKYPLMGNQGENEKIYAHDIFTKKALAFIDRHRDTSFFLYIPYTIPHDRYQIPTTEPYSNQAWSREEKVHAAMITRMDADIGKILQKLSSYNLDSSTVIFFCSDNGAARRWDDRFDSSGVLRGRKRDLYEGGIRTPMIVRAPGRVKAGWVNHTSWYFADILPTLAALANAPTPKNIDGINMWPNITDDQPTSPRVLYWEFHERGFQQALLRDEWKIINLGKDQDLELYHIRMDPDEQHNVAAQHPSKIDSLTLILNLARTPSLHWPTE